MYINQKAINNFEMELSFSVKKITKYISLTVVMLIISHILFQTIRLVTPCDNLFGIINFFDFDNESSIPTWFSQIQLFIASLILGLIAIYKKKHKKSFANHWLWLALIFLYLSIDEGATVHEMLIDPTKRVLNISSGVFYFAWVIPFMALVLGFLMFFISFIKHLPKKYKILFSLSGFIYILGTLGIEMVGGEILNMNLSKVYYLISVSIEESFEMIGMTLFIFTLLTFIKETSKEPLILKLK